MPSEFRCQSERRLSQGLTTYEAIVDPRSIFTGAASEVPFSSVSDGSSKTLLVVEAASPVPWTKPEDLSLAPLDRPLGVGSKHRGGFNASMADGSVRFIKTTGKDAISAHDLRSLVTRDGHEAVAAP
jgi:prepilin-type processing-associated H-X9-DG protein